MSLNNINSNLTWTWHNVEPNLSQGMWPISFGLNICYYLKKRIGRSLKRDKSPLLKGLFAREPIYTHTNKILKHCALFHHNVMYLFTNHKCSTCNSILLHKKHLDKHFEDVFEDAIRWFVQNLIAKSKQSDLSDERESSFLRGFHVRVVGILYTYRSAFSWTEFHWYVTGVRERYNRTMMFIWFISSREENEIVYFFICLFIYYFL